LTVSLREPLVGVSTVREVDGVDGGGTGTLLQDGVDATMELPGNADGVDKNGVAPLAPEYVAKAADDGVLS
jgi:hypothetical protein